MSPDLLKERVGRVADGYEPVMILSGHLHDRPSLASASPRLTARLAEIEARRRTAELTVDALVASWQGGAARRWDSRWQEWESAAEDTIDSLSALLGALDLARAELTEVDDVPAVPRQGHRREAQR